MSMRGWLVFLVACAGDKGSTTDPTDGSVDGDADTDADADSDSEADSDTDSDTDTDTDSDTDLACADDALSGPITVTGTTVGAGDEQSSTDCPGIGAGEDYAYGFTVPTTGRYLFDMTGTAYNDILYLRDGCTGGELACSDAFNGDLEGLYESIAFDATAGQELLVVVDSFDAGGDYSLTISEIPTIESTCDDGLDDDHDGAFDCDDADCDAVSPCFEALCDDGTDDDVDGPIDCLDPDCAAAANCAAACPDLTLTDVGSVVGTTRGAPHEGSGSCDFGAVAPDVSVAFTAPRTSQYGFATVELATNFSSVLYVTDGCGGPELACDDAANPGGGGDTVVVDLVAGQTVIAVVDGIGGAFGDFELEVFDLAGDEGAACADGIDNDLDTLIDCDDPDCTGDVTCVEICTDNVDNDGDHLADCLDQDCAIQDVCAEICDDGIDNDDDFRPDCLDKECALFADCLESVCDDGLDDDGNGFVDCQDTDCSEFPACREICDDGIDNDGDFAVDCEDLQSCGGSPLCVEDCADGIDNDGDFGADCADTDCDAVVACIETACNDNLDNDGNFLADCRDPDCDLAPACAENCNDGVDNDADGFADCADPACAAAPVCQEQCANGIDDDGNFLADCLDPDCDFDTACAEDCVDGSVDDDGDGRFDCLDPYCTTDPACGVACPALDLGAVVPVTAVGDTFGAPDTLTPSCGFGGLFGAASDETFSFTAPADGDYLFDSRGTSFAAVLTVLDGDCGGPELICESGAFSDNPIVTVTLTAGQTVVAVVDGSDYTQAGGYVLNVYAAP